MSASAPAGMESRKIGSELAACTSATHSGVGASSTISHPAPTSRIHVPTLAASVAIHSER